MVDYKSKQSRHKATFLKVHFIIIQTSMSPTFWSKAQRFNLMVHVRKRHHSILWNFVRNFVIQCNVCCNFHAQFCQLLYLSAYLPNPIQWKKLGKLSMQKLFIKCWWNLSLNGIFAVVAGIFLTDINCEGSEKK